MSNELSRRSVLRTGLAVATAGAAGIGLTGRAVAAERAGSGDGRGIALVNITVIDAVGGPPRPGQTVVVRGGRIVALGGQHDVSVPREMTVVDMSGKFVIPGLCDMHVHSEDFAEIYPPLYIANGVTMVREMSGYPFMHEWRNRVETGELLGPRSIIGSPMVDGSPSLWTGTPASFIEVRDAAEARQVVRQVKRDGADFVKVYTRLSRETFHALAEEARRQRIPLAGHCPDFVPVTEASDAGLRSVEHVFSIWYSTSSREAEIRQAIADMTLGPGDYNGWFHKSLPLDWISAHSYDPGKASTVFAHLAANGCRQVPTLIMHRVLGMPESVSPTDERLKYLPPATVEYWQWALNEFYLTGRTPEESAQHRELVGHRGRFVDNLRHAGVPVMAGTEAGLPYCFPGFAVHDELAELVGAGFTSMQALQAATREPARFLGLHHSLGTIEHGKVADLVVLDADPLLDIRNTQKIHALLVRGRFISTEQRQRMLSDVEAAARGATASTTPPACGCTPAAAARPTAGGA